MRRIPRRTQTPSRGDLEKFSGELLRRPEISGAVTEQANGGDRLAEDDANGHENGACTGRIGNGDFKAGAFGILIAAPETDAAFREIFADGNLFLKTSLADAGENTGFDPGAVAAGNNALFDGGARRLGFE